MSKVAKFTALGIAGAVTYWIMITALFALISQFGRWVNPGGRDAMPFLMALHFGAGWVLLSGAPVTGTLTAIVAGGTTQGDRRRAIKTAIVMQVCAGTFVALVSSGSSWQETAATLLIHILAGLAIGEVSHRLDIHFG